MCEMLFKDDMKPKLGLNETAATMQDFPRFVLMLLAACGAQRPELHFMLASFRNRIW